MFKGIDKKKFFIYMHYLPCNLSPRNNCARNNRPIHSRKQNVFILERPSDEMTSIWMSKGAIVCNITCYEGGLHP